MQNRILQHIKGSSNAVPWLGTFHSISVKFLRRHAKPWDIKVILLYLMLMIKKTY